VTLPKSIRPSFALAAIAAALLAVSVPTVTAAEGLNVQGLADACTSCHGLEGHSQGFIPTIGGVEKSTLLRQLKAFKDQKGSATIMNRIARGYTDAELEALAQYFSTAKQP
jgi:sulfide dehydrogenase cytochrome subunit